MRKPKGGAAAFLLFICLGIILPAAIFFAGKSGNSVEREYLDRGIPVSCIVDSVTNIGKNQSVTAKYQAADGSFIHAEAVPNKRVALGEEFEAYVLPESPYKVYSPAPAVMKYIFYGLAALFVIAGWAAPVLYIKAVGDYRLLRDKGIPVKAELISISEIDGNRFGKFRFVSASGNEHTVELGITHGSPFLGDRYDVLYAEKKNGRCAAELIDFKLV